MLWSIIIMTDVVCVEVATQCPNRCRWQAYERGVVTIRKLVLHTCCKNKCLNMCHACATAIACPNIGFYQQVIAGARGSRA